MSRFPWWEDTQTPLISQPQFISVNSISSSATRQEQLYMFKTESIRVCEMTFFCHQLFYLSFSTDATANQKLHA